MDERQRDLLLTAVLLGVLLTPAWLIPQPWSLVWQLVVLLLAVPALMYSWRHAPWQPTPRAELERLVALLALTPDQRFCDLGAGDGRLVLWVHAATGAHCVGIEASPLQWLVARVRLALQGGQGTEVRLGDLYEADLSEFDVLYVWGTAYSVGTPAFAEAMKAHARPGARLVSYHTPVPGWTPLVEDHEGQRPLFVYAL
ncbi:MAG: class I SAM-dependent methyltransferase [Deltaproteobacteria bacterium]|nr:MAG: class I SAM-dependent methyltransferase [Deltaproteobacteria bacterium]